MRDRGRWRWRWRWRRWRRRRRRGRQDRPGGLELRRQAHVVPDRAPRGDLRRPLGARVGRAALRPARAGPRARRQVRAADAQGPHGPEVHGAQRRRLDGAAGRHEAFGRLPRQAERPRPADRALPPHRRRHRRRRQRVEAGDHELPAEARPLAGSSYTAPPMRIFSGIQPTGAKHLGNYVGAIRRWVDDQNRGEALFCVVDLHALTVPYDPVALRESTLSTAATLMAAGLDPECCILFRQSDVHEHTELTWLLSSVTAHGDLNRMTQFKDKSAKQRELVSAGLYFYPVLMAADVLAYRANEVPVGDDQRQHVELMRDVAQRFNERFGELLVVPEGTYPEVGARIMDLQEPENKMSTTGGTPQGTVLVLDDEKTVTKKFKSAVTDSGSEVRRGPDKAGITNLIDILSVVRGVGPEEIEREFDGGGYGAFKSAVAEEVAELLRPVRERYQELRADDAEIERALAAGAEKARSIASETLRDVRAVMGVGPPS